MFDLVIAHARCMDGLVSAWLYKRINPAAKVIFANYGDEPPDVKGRKTLVVDFSYPAAVLKRMHEDALDLLVLDHHKTAEAELADLEFCKFDMNRSGAQMTYDHFYTSEFRPWFVEYTADRDLWTWKLPNSRAINAALRTYPIELESVDKWAAVGVDGMVAMGETVLRIQDGAVQHAVSCSFCAMFENFQVRLVNATSLISEIGEQMSKDVDFSISWFENDSGDRIFSLRSASPNGVDVSEIAKRYGGGGHKHAAGFRLPVTGNVWDDLKLKGRVSEWPSVP